VGILTDLCGYALSVGDLVAHERYLTLRDESARYAGVVHFYGPWAQMERATIAAQRGDVKPGLAFLDHEDLSDLAHPRLTYVLGEFALALGMAGAKDVARDLADHLHHRIEASGEMWIWSELQRVRGELTDDEAWAISLFERALEVAQAQGARTWALRAATSLARRRPHTAADILAPLLASFTEGAGTKDHRAASEILARAGVELA
jgi:adenylate cyclase